MFAIWKCILYLLKKNTLIFCMWPFVGFFSILCLVGRISRMYTRGGWCIYFGFILTNCNSLPTIHRFHFLIFFFFTKKTKMISFYDSEGNVEYIIFVAYHLSNSIILIKLRLPLRLYCISGNVPLHSAVHGGDIRAVELCINSGAKISTQQHDLSTPVHLACAQVSCSVHILFRTCQ